MDGAELPRKVSPKGQMTSAMNNLACAIPDSILQSGVAGEPLKHKHAQTERAAGFTPTRRVQLGKNAVRYPNFWLKIFVCMCVHM